MNPQSHENPGLTSYALGELGAHEAAQVHGLLRISPSAASELEQIEAVTEALRQEAPLLMDRLHPAQRQAVLNPAPMPRMMTPMMPRPMPARRPPVWPVISGLLKAAAVVALSAAGYWAGRHSGWTTASPALLTSDDAPRSEQALVEGTSPETVPLETPAALPAPPAPVEAAPSPASAPEPMVAQTTAPEKAPEPAAPAPPQTHPAQAPAQVAMAESTLLPAPPPAPAAAATRTLTRPADSAAFVSTTRQAVSQFTLRPADIRPPPPRPVPGQTFAAPMTARPGARENGTVKTRPPELYIHSWKAEVAACPWNTGHRLMRVTLQLPADQPAAAQPFSYPLQVAFDPHNVREYRQLCERHHPAAELRSAGVHSVWYEFLPNGSLDSGKTVATVTLPQGRFTTQTVGPFDGSKLSVQDRGLDWRAAREDFIFDSAVVGFSLLLRGVSPTPQLNHQLVLTLAEKTLATDTSGERQRFVRQVREARKAAGL